MFGDTFVPGGMLSGIYTPTITPNLNCASAVLNGSFIYSRIKNVVNVSGSLTVQATAAGNVYVYATLPFPSNFSDSYDLSGNVTIPNYSYGSAIGLAGSPGQLWTFVYHPDNIARFYRLFFSYVIK